MRRSQALERLTAGTFDVAVIGGGIYGVAIAWQAAARGLRVAVLDRADFGSGTSANSLRTIHGGLRYLQHLDLGRMRESIRARREWLQQFPEYVVPVECAIPTFGHGIFGREILALALLANDVISADRNAGLDAAHRLGRGRTCSRSRAERIFGGTAVAGYNGAALWYDGLCLNSERVLIEVLKRAMALGAVAVNHFDVERVLLERRRVTGVAGLDTATGTSQAIRASSVVNASGPWIDDLLRRSGIQRPQPLFRPSRAFNLVTRRLPFQVALGLPVRRERSDRDALIDRRSDTFFVMPYGSYSLIGTRHLKANASHSARLIEDDEIRAFVAELNTQLGQHALAEDDILGVYAGLLPESEHSVGEPYVTLEKHGRLIDHAADGARGLWSVLSVKWTTALRTAATLAARLGGDGARRAHRAPAAAAGALSTRPAGSTAGSLRERIEQAVDHEMAASVADVVMRRTQLYLDPSFDDAALAECAAMMGRKLGWTDAEIASNIVAARTSCDQFRWSTRAATNSGAGSR
jgi:glycerol-3-phosphate dehydrogenase